MKNQIKSLSLVVIIFVLTLGIQLKADSSNTQVIIGFTNGVDEKVVTNNGGKVIRKLANAKVIVATVGVGSISKIRASANVSYVEQDIEVNALKKPTSSPGNGGGGDDGEDLAPLPPQETPWGISRVGALSTSSTTRGAGIKVAIIDTGIDRTHPDLAANIKDGVNYTKAKSYNDDNGHGSHCAGSVAGIDNSEGVVGVAPNAHLYAVKVLDRRGSGRLSDVAAGINWAVANNMDVISMSLGSSSSTQTMSDACVAADAAGVLLVAASGNDGRVGSPASYPAAYPSVLAVGATDIGDNVADFSTKGSYVELSAPGVDVLSTYKNGGYAIASGTSMATPHVAGVVALVLTSTLYTGTTNAELRAFLFANADDLGAPGKDDSFGHGLAIAP